MGELVNFSANDRNVSGYMTVPPRGVGPTVIIIHEWWGLVQHIRDVVDRFAEAGFVALAPDLYDARITSHADEARRIMMGLRTRDIADTLVTTVAFLHSRLPPWQSRVGVVGFCMGGGLALWASTLIEDVKAVVAFYPVTPWPDVRPELSKMRAAVQGHFGAIDSVTPRAAMENMKMRLEAAGVEATLFVYDELGHGFFNDSRPEDYSEAGASQAWERMLTFLRDKLT